MFCENCGAELNQGAAFCRSCGKAVAAVSSPEAKPREEAQPTPVAASGLTSHGAGALCYALGALTGIIFLLSEPHKRDKFVRFHALQSIFSHLAVVAVWMVVWLGSTLLGLLSFGIASLLLLPIQLLLGLALFACWVFLIYKAYQGERYAVPYLGRIAETASEPSVLPSHVVAFLTYPLWLVTGIIFLVTPAYKNDKFVRFHAFQSLFYSGLVFVLYVFWAILTAVLINLGVFGIGIWDLLAAMWALGRFAVCGGWFFLMYKAYHNENAMLPVLGAIAAKQAGLCVEQKADASPAAN